MCKVGDKWVLAGVTSYGITETCKESIEKKYPEVFARISYFNQWIKNAMAQM